MGELLSSHENSFDSATTLVWENVNFVDSNEVLIHIPYSKTTGFKGKMIDIFEIKGNKNCPAAALRRVQKFTVSSGGYNDKKPVFSFSSGKNLAYFPEDYSVNIVKEWGMWESDSYTLYTKREWKGKRALFSRIVKSLYSY